MYIDLNQDGIQDFDDVGAANVSVRAVDSAGATETVLTDANGLYELLMDSDDVRIDFSGFPENTVPGRSTGTTGATVRFLDATSDRETVDLALTAPMLVTTQFFYDDALEGFNSGEAAVLAVPYGATDFLAPQVLATVNDVGSVWGLAYQPSSNSVYASSFVKRHAGLGPNAAGTDTTTGGIYRIDRSTEPATVSLLVDLNTAGAGFGAGADPHPTNPEGEETSADWFHDSATLAQVGKRGLGGLQITPDGRTMYVMNLNTRSLVEIPLNADGSRNMSGRLRTFPVPLTNPGAGGLGGFNAADLRPFAVAVRGNAVFVGVTHTAETSKNTATLRAYVYAFDPVQGAFRTYNQQTGVFATSGTANPVLTANLNYDRGVADDLTPGEPGDEVSADWTGWTSTFDVSRGNDGSPVHPSPWLTDIAFDGDAMVLAIRDRFGDQGGYQTGNASATNEDFFSVIASGDVLRASPNTSGGWVLESGGVAGTSVSVGVLNGQGPGGGEFYHEDNADPSPDDVGMGALAQVPGFKTIAMTGNDPNGPFAGGIYTLLNSPSGTGASQLPAGSVFSRTEIFASLDSSTFGSANGLGDLEFLPAIGTVQAGSRVFSDVNGNGLQDAGEPGISGVTLRLFQGATQLDSVTTGSSGDYLFDDLLPNTAYQIRVDMTQGALAGATISPANLGTNDELDSDATQSGSTATIPFTSGAEGSNNHSLDVGLRVGALAFSITIGDLVYRDNNASGTFDTGDVAIPGVVVELLDNLGVPVAGQTATTDANGLYSFTAVDDGTYSVRLAASNFTGTGALVNFTATSPSPDPDNNVDNDNNGAVSGTLGSGGFIVSGQIDVAEGTEPGSSNTNNTLDFGLIPVAGPTTLTLGDQIWRDADNDGIFDVGLENGIVGVAVELLDVAGVPVTGQTNTTDVNGTYSFTGLSAGTYSVRLAASNFNTGGVLFGLAPTSPSVANPNTDINNDNNGSTSGTLGSGGVVVSGQIVLALGSEPTTDGDADSNTNLSLDFGLTVPSAATLTLGNLVFNDLDNDGTFDVGTENGISGVAVVLLDSSGIPLNGQTDITDANGLYSFTGLADGTYSVQLSASNFSTGGVLFGFTPSSTSVANPNTDINNDSNGTTSGTLGSGGTVVSGQINLALGSEPITDGDLDADTNLSLDFGLVTPSTSTTLTLGDLVFNDLDNDGTFDVGTENGISGVLVELLDNGGAPTGQTDTTDANGLYSFAGLTAGTYAARLAASNFNTGGVLFGFTSSATSSADPNDNLNNDDNGIANGSLGSGGVIVSGPISLALDAEPTNDGDSSNDTNLSLDFGVVAPVATGLTLGNLVWNDVDNDGIFDVGVENGINGVLVELLDSNSVPVTGQTATTAGGGLYTFTGLAGGSYRVRLAASNFNTGGALVGFNSSTFNSISPDDDVNNNDDGSVSGTLGSGGVILSGLITLTDNLEPTDDGDTNNDTNLSLDFGVFNTAATGNLTLGNLVFRDTDNDGLFDTGETGVAGVLVELLDGTGTPIAGRTATTTADGVYTFGALLPGAYRVRLAASNFNTGGVLFNHTSSTFTEANPDDNQDNNDNGSASGTLGTGGFITSGTINLAVGLEPNTDGDTDTNTNMTLDFGVVAPVVSTTMTVGSQVWNDTNNDGLLNNGEIGLAGVSVQLIGPTGTVLQSTTTNATGNYSFTGLAAGDYRVRLAATNFTGTGILTGFTSSTGTNGLTTGPNEGSATPDPDTNIDNDDNGQVAGALGSIGGSIETGLFTLASGTEPINDGDTDASTNLSIDLGVFRKFSIGNVVFNDADNDGFQDTAEVGLNGVSVRLLDAANANALVGTTTTDTQGRYLFQALADGSYIVELAATNFNAGGSLFAFQSSTGGTGTPFEPAPSTALDKQDHGTTNGVLASGGTIRSGTIVLGPTANAPTLENPNNDTTTPDNQSNLRIDFGVFQQTPTTGSIAGRVFLDYNDSGTFNGPDVGISGVTITLSGGNLTSPITTTTDADGNYKFSNLVAGTYSVTETQPSAPANQNGRTKAGSAGGNAAVANVISNIVLANNQQATNYLFTEIPIISTGGFVYEDTNGNGLKNSGEPGIPGVVVTLTGTSVITGAITPRTFTTIADGSYTFDNLTPGTYTIVETQPTTFIDGQETNGTPAAGSVANDRFNNINLTTTAAASGGFNFGEVKNGGIGGVVYDDVNNDGTQAATGELGIAGVKITLKGTNDQGKAINLTTTTTATGAFSFSGVRPGTYRLIETQPVGYVDGTDKAGTGGGTANTTQNQITGINLTSSSSATGYFFGDVATADVVVSQSPTSATVNAGGTVTLTYTVRNRGTSDAGDVALVVNYGGMTFVSANTDDFDYDEDLREWSIGDLAPGETAVVRLTLRAGGSGSFGPSSRVSTSSDESSEGNNTATSSIFAGVSAPTSSPSGSFWFLSSSTNARRS